MKKKIVTIAMLAALAVGSVVSLTACGGGGSGSNAAPESSAAPASSAVESSAPSSSAAEVVSSEAAAPESETLDSSEELTLSLMEGVEIKDGTFQISPQELAERINAACSVTYAEQCTIKERSADIVTMSFGSGDITVHGKNGVVNMILVQTTVSVADAQTYWLPIMTALLGVDEVSASEETVNSHFANITVEGAEYCNDSWNGVNLKTHMTSDMYTMYFTAAE